MQRTSPDVRGRLSPAKGDSKAKRIAMAVDRSRKATSMAGQRVSRVLRCYIYLEDCVLNPSTVEICLIELSFFFSRRAMVAYYI